MSLLLLGVFLFSLTRPLGKIFLDEVPVDLFVFAFLFFRMVSQIPVAALTRNLRFHSWSHFVLLAFLGLIGTGLHFLEFKSLTIGLSVPTVSFLIFTHPIWIQIYRTLVAPKELTYGSITKLVVGIIGTLFIMGPEAIQLPMSWTLFIPLSASLFFASWVILSEKIQKEGVPMLQLSFYYDFFSLIFMGLGMMSSRGYSNVVQPLLSLSPGVAVSLLVFSVIVGVIANYLFFLGVKKTGSLVASYSLLLEPILASVIGAILFDSSSIGLFFLIGSGLIIFINVPESFYRGLTTQVRDLTAKFAQVLPFWNG